MNKPLPDIAIGILSWRGYDSLRATLDSYKQAGMLDLFSEKLLFLPQIEQQGIDIANEYSLLYKGTKENLGILGGFKAMAESLSSEYLLLAENDFQIADGITDTYTPLKRALDSLKSGESRVWRFRHLEHPGQKFYIGKVMKYWPADTAQPMTKITALLRRILRPNKSRKLKGMTVYIYPNSEERFPDVIKKTSTGDYLVRSDVINWANNIFMVKRDFFLNELIPTAEANISGRLINGFPTIETELNRSKWWKEQKFWVGISNPGLFTHDRLNDRGY